MDSNDKGCISGITCDVHNCVYNNSQSCHAGQIKVGPQYANNVGDTACDTFRAE